MIIGGIISLNSVKQFLTTTSTMHAEFVICYKVTCESLWMMNFVSRLQIVFSKLFKEYFFLLEIIKSFDVLSKNRMYL